MKNPTPDVGGGEFDEKIFLFLGIKGLKFRVLQFRADP